MYYIQLVPKPLRSQKKWWYFNCPENTVIKVKSYSIQKYRAEVDIEETVMFDIKDVVNNISDYLSGKGTTSKLFIPLQDVIIKKDQLFDLINLIQKELK